MKYWNKSVKGLEPYTPGEQTRDPSVIKLNTNENPFSPPEEVLGAIQKALTGDLRLYPQPDHRDLRKAVAGALGIEANNIFAGNGSDEVLSLIFRTFLETTDKIAIPEPSYSLYPVLSQIAGISVKKIKTEIDFQIDISRFLGNQALTLIPNPNAPTGIALPLEKIDKLTKNLNNLLVIDEAYIDFGAESALPLLKKYDNLIIVRTLSKGFSLAGIRLGFAFASGSIIDALYRMKDSYNLNTLTQAAGVSVFQNLKAFKNNIDLVKWNREFLSLELKKRGFDLTDSRANFVFARHRSYNAEKLFLDLRDSNILVRYFPNELTKDWLRITVGTMQQLKEFLRKLDKIL